MVWRAGLILLLGVCDPCGVCSSQGSSPMPFPVSPDGSAALHQQGRLRVPQRERRARLRELPAQGFLLPGVWLWRAGTAHTSPHLPAVLGCSPAGEHSTSHTECPSRAVFVGPECVTTSLYPKAPLILFPVLSWFPMKKPVCNCDFFFCLHSSLSQ